MKYSGRMKIGVAWMCSEAGVSRSGYYSYKARKTRSAEAAGESRDRADFDLVKQVYDYRGRPKGSRTIAMMMPRLLGIVMNRKKIRRLMGKYGLMCPVRKANPLKRIAKAIRTDSTFANKLNRQFAIGRPGEHLLTDISYIYYGPHLGRRCFLSTLKDASTNEIIAWTLSESIDMRFVMEMLRKLDSVEWLPFNVLIHSDQGCHYTSWEYRRYLTSRNIAQSMSRRGNCWDNAPQESFFGHAKDELRLKGCATFNDVFREISDYMDYYNRERPQMGLSKMTPIEFREFLSAKPRTLPMVIEEKNGGRPAAILI